MAKREAPMRNPFARAATLALPLACALAGVVPGYIAGHATSRAAYLHARRMADVYAAQRDSALAHLTVRAPVLTCPSRTICLGE